MSSPVTHGRSSKLGTGAPVVSPSPVSPGGMSPVEPSASVGSTGVELEEVESPPPSSDDPAPLLSPVLSPESASASPELDSSATAGDPASRSEERRVGKGC